MGYLTTVTIYNDDASQIIKNPEEFAQKIYDATSGVYTRNGKSGYFGVGYHANLVTVQKPRHADDSTVYVHLGNTLTEMNADSTETKELAKNNPDFFEGALYELKRQIKELENLIKK